MIKKITLEINLVHNVSAVYDAIGETLFLLAKEGIIDDTCDDGWEWKEEEVVVETPLNKAIYAAMIDEKKGCENA